uniref:FAS1 domain-containing protein n=1 Tax=Brassica oleracea var. oleracea TaxID=109376 RepID=A0A0D3E184_BRAOL
MLQITGKYRSRSSRRYQKLGHHYEKATTRTIRHNWGKKIEGRSKGFRLNRPRKLVLNALVLPRRISSIYSRVKDKLNKEATMRSLFLTISPLFFFLLTILASTVTEPRPTPILRHDNQSSDLVSAISDMRRESYYGFVTLLHILNDTDFFRSQEITFLMPNDEDISQADMTRESLETFILRHAIPAWLMINHMLRFPNKTLVPCSIPDRMFTITKSGGSGLFVNNARIVSPNICQNSRISCHGISNVITFNEDSFPKGRLSPKMLSSRINSSRH